MFIVDVDNIIWLIEAKIPDNDELVDNQLLSLRYIRLCSKVKNWLQNTSKKDSKLKILDFGCGYGQNVIILKKMGFEVVGLGLDKLECWKNIDAKMLTYDGINMPFDPSEFDAVVMFGVLEHIGPYPRDITKFEEYQEMRKKCLIGISNVLRDNRLLFIFNFPNKYSPIEMINTAFKLPNRHDKTDMQGLNQVKKIVKDSGYTILRSGRIGVIPAFVGAVSPFVKHGIVNKHYRGIGRLDYLIDSILGNALGQSNYVIT